MVEKSVLIEYRLDNVKNDKFLRYPCAYYGVNLYYILNRIVSAKVIYYIGSCRTDEFENEKKKNVNQNS